MDTNDDDIEASFESYEGTCALTFLLGIPILVMGIWLKFQQSTDCESFLSIPLIILGSLLLFFSVLGFYWAARSNDRKICIHGYIIFILLTTLLGYTIFALVVTTEGGGEPLARREYKEYRLEDYSSWFRKRFDKTHHWNQIKTCLFKTHVCSKFQDKFGGDTQDQFFSNKLSSIQSGCCKPSNDCNMKYISPTEWTKTKEENYTNEDCYKWSNDKDVFCFNCQSCKAGFADNVKRHWRKTGIICIVFMILLIVISFSGCICVENPHMLNKSHYGY
ncbi:unnamed protein product [Amaranthus hypochondriacus]